jgi:hypothetical protein
MIWIFQSTSQVCVTLAKPKINQLNRQAPFFGLSHTHLLQNRKNIKTTFIFLKIIETLKLSQNIFVNPSCDDRSTCDKS